MLASHRLPVAAAAQLVRRPRRRRARDEGLRRAGRAASPRRSRSLDPETLLPVAPPLRLPEPSIARLASDGESVIAVGTTTVFRLRLDRDAGRLAIDEHWRPALRPGARPQLRLGPGDHRRARLLDGQRAQPHRPDDARQRRRSRARCGSGGRGATTARSRSVEISGLPYGTESNPPAWDPERADRRRLRRRQRRRARLAAARATSSSRSGAATARPRRPPDPLPRHARARRRRLARHEPRCAGRSCGRRVAAGLQLARALGARRAAPRWRPAATSSSCSTSTPARRRRASPSPPRRRGSCSRPPASAATSTTSR